MQSIKENSRFGWIGLYRSIKDHWIYPNNRSFTKYEAWVDLMLMVNHSDNKVFNGTDIAICKRGEKITSQKKLMLKWGWSKSKLIKFLDVLKGDHMIDYKSDSKKTTIIVLNFINYQDFGKVDELKKDHKKTVERLRKDYEKTIKELTKRLQKDTNNNDNKDNNENNNKIVSSGKDVFEFITNLPQTEIDKIKEFAFYQGDEKQYTELLKKFCIEFVGRYSINKTENEAIEIWQSWLSKERGKKKQPPKQDSFEILKEMFPENE